MTTLKRWLRVAVAYDDYFWRDVRDYAVLAVVTAPFVYLFLRLLGW